MNLSADTKSYLVAIDKILEREFTGMKLGLENITALLGAFGNPHKAYPTIHIAGTNGKGSTSSMIAAALQANGMKVGLYTSPHLVDYTERIRINGINIPKGKLVELAEMIWSEVEKGKATFFEITTAIMFKYFADEHIDIAVIETGLGGRLDSTNILESPLATVITSIGFDHMQHLGSTLELIASEKAGILKNGSPAIVNVKGDLKNVFRKKADEVGAPLIFVDEVVLPTEYADLRSPFPGEHQKLNMKTALLALEHSGLALDRMKSIDRINRTAELTGLRARLEQYSYPPAAKKQITLILDVGHNPPAFESLRDHFRSIGVKPIVVAGFAKDKDISGILEIIREFSSGFVAVAANNHRALDAKELQAKATQAGMIARSASSVTNGVNETIHVALDGETILLTGSHYVVGEFLQEEFKNP